MYKMSQAEKDKLKTAVENNYVSIEGFLLERKQVLTKEQIRKLISTASRIEQSFDRKLLSIRTGSQKYIKIFPKETLEKAINLI